jgi:hypothetical protein
MNFAFADAKLPIPFGRAITPGPGMVGGTNYDYVASDGDYQIESINLGMGQKVLINGKARLCVTGPTSLSADAYVVINSGASVEWYAGAEVTWGGRGCINTSGFAKNFSIIGLSSAPIAYNGNSSFIGTIYAPTAPVSIAGSADAYGAIVGDTISVLGDMSLHFDESLAYNGPQF